VELLEHAGELDAAEEVLTRYAGRGHYDRAWPNALQLLYAFYERHPHPGGGDDRRRWAVLERLVSLVPSHPLTLALYRQRRRDDPATTPDDDPGAVCILQIIYYYYYYCCLQCFDTVGWAAGTASEACKN